MKRNCRVWPLLVIITACGTTQDVTTYNADYSGQVATRCWGEVRLYGRVINGIFAMSLPARHDLHGTVTTNGEVSATGTWTDDQGIVHATFVGQISSKLFGRTLSGQLQDGRCNPDVTLYLRRGQ